MSYQIYYDKAFIKVNDKFVPMVNSGSNNCWEVNYCNREIPEKNWSVLNYTMRSKVLFTADEIVEIAKRYELNSKAPEVLFIEACYNFLKPGGKMAIVLPDGILGNPNTEEVRLWILKHFKLIASVDLPVETFLPQVGVQASLLFLQKKTDDEMLVPIENEDYDVFMAIVEQVGKDRRGVPIYERDDDGAEILFPRIKRWLAYNEFGREVVRSRNERVKRLADDLPKVAEAYRKFRFDKL